MKSWSLTTLWERGPNRNIQVHWKLDGTSMKLSGLPWHRGFSWLNLLGQINWYCEKLFNVHGNLLSSEVSRQLYQKCIFSSNSRDRLSRRDRKKKMGAGVGGCRGKGQRKGKRNFTQTESSNDRSILLIISMINIPHIWGQFLWFNINISRL